MSDSERDAIDSMVEGATATQKGKGHLPTPQEARDFVVDIVERHEKRIARDGAPKVNRDESDPDPQRVSQAETFGAPEGELKSTRRELPDPPKPRKRKVLRPEQRRRILK